MLEYGEHVLIFSNVLSESDCSPYLVHLKMYVLYSYQENLDRIYWWVIRYLANRTTQLLHNDAINKMQT